MRTIQRRNFNKITAQCNSNGEWIFEPKVLKVKAVIFFQKLYREVSGPLGCFPLSVFQSFNSKAVTFLERIVSKEEIKIALFDMVPLKALGSDGFHATFFQS